MDKLYIISFSDSRKYKLRVTDEKQLSVVDDCEKYLKERLKERFPAENLPFYSKPQVKEVPLADAAKYEGYDDFTPEVFPKIADKMLREVQVMNDTRLTDSDGPHSTPFSPQ